MNRITTLAAIAASVAVYNRKPYTFGGCLSQSGAEAPANAWKFDPVADSWEFRL